MNSSENIRLGKIHTNLMNWIYYNEKGAPRPGTVPYQHLKENAGDVVIHEYLRLVMWAEVIGLAALRWNGIPASDGMIAKHALNIPKKVRDAALNFAVNLGLLERRAKTHPGAASGIPRYYPTDLYFDVIKGRVPLIATEAADEQKTEAAK